MVKKFEMTNEAKLKLLNTWINKHAFKMTHTAAKVFLAIWARTIAQDKLECPIRLKDFMVGTYSKQDNINIEGLGFSESTVRRAINELEQNKYITKEPTYNEYKSNDANLYKINIRQII